MGWAWWDWPLTWLTNHRPSVLWHCWLGHVTRKTVSKMTYNVSSGTLNSTIPYHVEIITDPYNVKEFLQLMRSICPAACDKPCYIFLKTGHIWWVEFDFERECKGSTIFTQRSQFNRMLPQQPRISNLSIKTRSFLSASLYFSKSGAYWDRLCRDVVGWLVVTRVHCGQTVHPRPIVTMEH